MDVALHNGELRASAINMTEVAIVDVGRDRLELIGVHGMRAELCAGETSRVIMEPVEPDVNGVRGVLLLGEADRSLDMKAGFGGTSGGGADGEERLSWLRL